jgi:hypothetical protein
MGARRTQRRVEKRPDAPGNRTRTLSFLLAAGLCLLALKTLSCPLFFQKTIPDALRGTWSTTDPKMQDRTLQLTDRLVIFGLGHGRQQIGTVTRLQIQNGEGGSAEYTIYYCDDDRQELMLAFFYWPASGGTLQLKNRTEVWHRIASGVTT